MSTDFDSPWKEALDVYFEAFLALLFPNVHREIDWSRPPESLDKEFQQVVRDAEVGRRYVDKLVMVWTTAGLECWVLVHVEVQTTRDQDFPLRMFVYNYSIFDRYNKPVASLAVLADDDPDWRPTEFSSTLFGCEAGIRFPTAKLLDLTSDEAALDERVNPFAMVVLAHRKAQETRNNPANRRIWKLRLVRGLFERGFGSQDVRELFRLIDWMLELPQSLDELFRKEIEAIQKEKVMPYVTSIERSYRKEGMREGIQSLLKVRFGDDGLKLMPEIEQVHNEEQLREIMKTLETAANLEEVRRVWTASES